MNVSFRSTMFSIVIFHIKKENWNEHIFFSYLLLSAGTHELKDADSTALSEMRVSPKKGRKIRAKEDKTPPKKCQILVHNKAVLGICWWWRADIGALQNNQNDITSDPHHGHIWGWFGMLPPVWRLSHLFRPSPFGKRLHLLPAPGSTSCTKLHQRQNRPWKLPAACCKVINMLQQASRSKLYPCPPRCTCCLSPPAQNESCTSNPGTWSSS